MQDVVQARYEAALAKLMERVEADTHIIGAVLCGSLAYDRVWDHSDIDLVLISTDDRKAERRGITLTEDGINIHAQVLPRAQFKRRIEGARSNSFDHSLFARGQLIFCRDESLRRLFTELGEVGQRDTQVQLLHAAAGIIPPFYKAQKWLQVRGDLDYSALYILYTARAMAEVELIRRGELVSREVLPRALALDETLFTCIYVDLLNKRKTKKAVSSAIAAIDSYLRKHARTLFEPIFDYLRDSAAPRSMGDISFHFERNFAVHGVLEACEWLADVELIERDSIPAKLTTQSQVEVEELAFFLLPDQEA